MNGIGTCVWLQVVGGKVRQSVHHRLGRWWGRVWIGWWWLACVITTAYYTSNLVAFLTVPVFPRRIETVQELATSGLRLVSVPPSPNLYSTVKVFYFTHARCPLATAEIIIHYRLKRL